MNEKQHYIVIYRASSLNTAQRKVVHSKDEAVKIAVACVGGKITDTSKRSVR